MELSFLARASIVVSLAALTPGCLAIARTGEFRECEGDECDDGAGGGATATGSSGTSGTGSTGTDAASTGTGSTGTDAASSGTGSTGTGEASCVMVTVTVEEALGDVRVELDPDDVDFDVGTRSECIPFGTKTIEVECDPEDGDRYPLDVDWGNPLCPRGSSCTFELTEPQEFVLSGATCR